MILFLVGLFMGAALGVMLLSLFVAGKLRDTYLQGRLDEIADAARETANG